MTGLRKITKAQLRYHPVKRFGIADEREGLIEALE